MLCISLQSTISHLKALGKLKKKNVPHTHWIGFSSFFFFVEGFLIDYADWIKIKLIYECLKLRWGQWDL